MAMKRKNCGIVAEPVRTRGAVPQSAESAFTRLSAPARLKNNQIISEPQPRRTELPAREALIKYQWKSKAAVY